MVVNVHSRVMLDFLLRRRGILCPLYKRNKRERACLLSIGFDWYSLLVIDSTLSIEYAHTIHHLKGVSFPSSVTLSSV
jgi:hypothetical protein